MKDNIKTFKIFTQINKLKQANAKLHAELQMLVTYLKDDENTKTAYDRQIRNAKATLTENKKYRRI
jgi:hypothetical protein